ncbi:MAG: hypothetical protein OQK99_03625 [Gammaproteobacteria bacterium]|nr:hypothetical protein [Gammaproteobacteria bacterium]
MTEDITPDGIVEDLRGDLDGDFELEGDGADGDGEGSEQEFELDPRFASVQELMSKFDKTLDISQRTAKNLTKERAKTKALEKRLAELEGREPEDIHDSEPEDERVQYRPEGEPGQEYYDEAVFQRVMSQNDPNWEAMKSDDVYTGQARAIMKAMMTAVGNMSVELQGMKRQAQMASVGVTQQEVEEFLSIPQFSHLRGLPFEQVADVLSGMRQLAGNQPRPSTPQGDGASRRVKRDPTALGATNSGGKSRGTMQPADAINAALDAGNRDEARKIAAGLFFSGMQ